MKKLLFAADGDDHRKPQLVKMKRATDHGVPCPNLYIYNTTPKPSVQRSSQRENGKIKRARRPGLLLYNFSVLLLPKVLHGLSLPLLSSHTRISAHICHVISNVGHADR